MVDSTINQQVTINGTTVIIYNNRKPDSYAITDIFDPDNPKSGKYFPSLYSLIIKEDGTLWYVVARDESTYRVTLAPVPCSSDDTNKTQIITYGNDKFMLYVDERTDPHKLVVDAKLLFFGNNLTEYALYRTNSKGKEECISMYYDSTDRFISNRIPMITLSPDYISHKYPSNCHTTYDLTEGEPIILRVFNNLGNQAAEITIYVRFANILNDLSSHTNPIVKLDAECVQTRGDDFYLYTRQEVEHLNIRPYLVFADGSKQYVDVDNQRCFISGLTDFIASYPGHSQPIVIKYFLSHRETATDVTTNGSTRFITCTKNITVLKNADEYQIKLSCIPLYNNSTGQWYLRFFAYDENRERCYDVTQYISYVVSFTFNGENTKWGVRQHVRVLYDLQELFNADESVYGAQDFWITVWDPYNRYVRYTIAESETASKVYGADGSIVRRPIIHKDTTRNSFFIPTSIFENLEAMLESFYLLANPPFDYRTEAEAPTPSHFVIRSVYSGKQLISTPIPVSEYDQEILLLASETLNEYDTVLVEFLYNFNGTYQILFGVPVDVRNSETGYQG